MAPKPFGTPLNRRQPKEVVIPKGVVKKMIEEQTPLPGLKCKAEGCEGNVVREAVGLFRGQIHYDMPHCKVCQRLYIHAQDAPKIGAQEFLDSLCRPMTI